MPDHFHGIIFLTDKNDNDIVVGVKHCRQDDAVGAKHYGHINSESGNDLGCNASPQQSRFNGTKPGSIPAIIQNFSSITTRKINQIRRTPGSKIWQRGYYEHIIRDEQEYYAIRKYIIDNPIHWDKYINNL